MCRGISMPRLAAKGLPHPLGGGGAEAQGDVSACRSESSSPRRRPAGKWGPPAASSSVQQEAAGVGTHLLSFWVVPHKEAPLAGTAREILRALPKTTHPTPLELGYRLAEFCFCGGTEGQGNP